MRSLSIALLTHSVNPRGGVVHTIELANALHDRGHRVTVFAPALPGQRLFRTPRCAVELVPIVAAPAGMVEMVASRRAAYVRHLASLLRSRSFDILHTQDAIGANALADLCDGGAIDSFVRTVHHLDEFEDPRLVAWQERGFRRAGQVLCVSQLWRDILQRDHGISASLVSNGVDLTRFSRVSTPFDADVAARYGLRSGAPLFLAVGGIEERKNTVRILQAFTAFRSDLPDSQLVITGGASLLDHGAYGREFGRILQEGVLGCERGGPVVITGAVTDDCVSALMRMADVLLMPSVREGFGMVVLEALASGTPAVVSRIPPFTEYLSAQEFQDHCCWADPLSSSSIAQAMHRACQPLHALALAERTPDVCTRFSWQASAANHELIYRARLSLAPSYGSGVVNPHAYH